MLKTVKQNLYMAFGLKVISEIELPELLYVVGQINSVDVRISIGDLEFGITEFLNSEEKVSVSEKRILFEVPKLAIFSVNEGKEIIVSPLEDYNEDAARLYILGTCMGAILLQRKILPLHGSAIVIEGKAYAVVGDSGVGKSTLASAFVNKGYLLLTDDVIAITISTDGTPLVSPSYPQQKLWEESLSNLGMKKKDYKPLVDRVTKYAIPVQSQFSREIYPLAGVFELIKTNNEEIEIQPIKGLNGLYKLFYHTYRNFMISPSRLTEWHFSTTTKIYSKIDFFQLRRPVSRFTTNDLIEVILDNI